MIHSLDRTLKKIIESSMPRSLAKQITISFATPDDKFPPSEVKLPAVNLFLYDVRENRELRSTEWRTERRSDGTASKKRPPVRVDCAYLITAWPSSEAPNPPEDEHRILGEVMKVLLRYPTIPLEALADELQSQELPLPAVSLQAGQLQSLAEFWQALGGKPKAALHFTVTIGVDAHEPLTAAPPVTDKRLEKTE